MVVLSLALTVRPHPIGRFCVQFVLSSLLDLLQLHLSPFKIIKCIFSFQIISSTPLIDLSSVYGNFLKNLQEKGRTFQGGLLKYEVEEGRVWPPSTKTQANVCFLNQRPHEKRCHDMRMYFNISSFKELDRVEL